MKKPFTVFSILGSMAGCFGQFCLVIWDHDWNEGPPEAAAAAAAFTAWAAGGDGWGRFYESVSAVIYKLKTKTKQTKKL
jgi:hypothetical protein